eukprot:scaffold103437_cov69-Phaeocystis_antarctica.AAC.4
MASLPRRDAWPSTARTSAENVSACQLRSMCYCGVERGGWKERVERGQRVERGGDEAWRRAVLSRVAGTNREKVRKTPDLASSEVEPQVWQSTSRVRSGVWMVEDGQPPSCPAAQDTQRPSCPHNIKQDKTDRLRRGGKEPVYYHSYLQLDQLLSSTRLLSAPASPDPATLAERNLQGAHDEHLFIIIHQTYELWFKQILWELDSVVVLFDADYIPEASVGLATGRLHRISEILRILVDQLTVLETMSPMQFLDFRDHLFPASGFQSLQWRHCLSS